MSNQGKEKGFVVPGGGKNIYEDLIEKVLNGNGKQVNKISHFFMFFTQNCP